MRTPRPHRGPPAVHQPPRHPASLTSEYVDGGRTPDDLANLLATHRDTDQPRGPRAQRARAFALGGPTLGWVVAAADGFDGFEQPGALAHLRIPIIVCSAGEEALVSNEAHEIIASHLPNAKHVTIAGAKHEIMQETDDVRAQFFAYFDELTASLTPQRAMA